MLRVAVRKYPKWGREYEKQYYSQKKFIVNTVFTMIHKQEVKQF